MIHRTIRFCSGSDKVECFADDEATVRGLLPIIDTVTSSVEIKRSTYKRVHLFPKVDPRFIIKEHVYRFRPFRRGKARLEFSHSLKIAAMGVRIIPYIAMVKSEHSAFLIARYHKELKKLDEICMDDGTISRYASFCREVLMKGIFQYDFNPTNILIDNDKNMYLCDFEKVAYKKPTLNRICWVLARLSRYDKITKDQKMLFVKEFFRESVWNDLGFIIKKIENIKSRYGY